MLRVIQLSDTHFGPDGHRSHGGFGYDTDAAFDAVAERIATHEPVDLIVVTGDLADQGQPEDYAKARAALSRLPASVNLCPGNHDFQVPFEVGLAHPGLSMARTMRLGSWLFMFADSNFDGRQAGPGGRLIDVENRIEAKGLLGPGELSWLHDVIGASDADHVFVWLHHPPGVPLAGFNVPQFDEEITDLVSTHDRVRGFGAGHIHSDNVLEIAGRSVFVCPALTINIDFQAATLLPPGFRSYEFSDDGTVESTCHLLDGETWPRRHVPEVSMRFIAGEIGFDEMMAGLDERRRRRRAAADG